MLWDDCSRTVALGRFSKMVAFPCLLLKDDCSGTVALGQYGEVDGGVYSSKWGGKKHKKLGDIYAYFCIDRITEQIRHDRPYVVNGEKKILIYPAPGAELKGGPSTRCSIQWSTRWSTR